MTEPSQYLLDYKASDFYVPSNLETQWSLQTLLSFAALGAIYGGIHAASWNGHFPTRVEEMLWRISTSVIAGGGFLMCLLVVVLLWQYGKIIGGYFSRHLRWTRELSRTKLRLFWLPWAYAGQLRSSRYDHEVWSWGGIIVFYTILFCEEVILLGVIAAFCVSRAFIVVEAFISIRSLPAGAYDTVSWVGFLPHIGG